MEFNTKNSNLSERRKSHRIMRMTHFSPGKFKKSYKTNTTRENTSHHKRVKSYVDFKKMIGRGR